MSAATEVSEAGLSGFDNSSGPKRKLVVAQVEVLVQLGHSQQ